MSRFNLLDEPWIKVIDEEGRTKEVSLKELFQNAYRYEGLAGEMETQNFVIMRFLLAVLHTVFSRVDASGIPYEYFDLDDHFLQQSEVDEDDVRDYRKELVKTWENLWDRGSFPEVIGEYLEKWREHFFLYDDKYPFFQVTEEEIYEGIKKSKPSSIFGKNLNRMISESENKPALFAPKVTLERDKMTDSELVRWLLMLHGYIGLADKVVFDRGNYKSSKGWAFDIGGVYIQGKNLFETLMLNFVINNKKVDVKIQRPCWEYGGKENIDRLFLKELDNVTELYTNWSRAMHICHQNEISKGVQVEIVKIPEIEHKNQWLESMTMWKYNEKGDLKDSYTPKKHIPEQAMWRAYGNIVLFGNTKHEVGVIEWYRKIQKHIGDRRIKIRSVGMQDDANATSWLPINEITDSLNLQDMLVFDEKLDGWVIRVDGVVEMTKDMIERVYATFLREIMEIRNIQRSSVLNKGKEEIYSIVDILFREWIEGIWSESDKEEKVLEWKKTLQKVIREVAERKMKEASNRDWIGIYDEKYGTKNIFTAFEGLMWRVRKQLKL